MMPGQASDEDDADPRVTPVLIQESLASSAVDWITDRILEGRLEPGEKVTEARLAEQMGVSRSPVREALRVLARDGLVAIEPRRGAFVTELDAATARDLYVCRLLIEPVCAQESAAAMTDRREAVLAGIYARMCAAGETAEADAYRLAIWEYSERLLQSCPNRALASLAESSLRISMRYWTLTARSSPDYRARVIEHFGELHDAVAAHDGERARTISQAVLEASRDQLVILLAGRPRGRKD